MTRLAILLSIVCSAAAACAPSGASPAERRGSGSPASPTASGVELAEQPVKVRAWPAMKAWTRGRRVDREPTMTPAYAAKDLARYGARVYGMYCVNCHGKEGRGDGPRGPLFTPPPRDFTRAVYKFRSTAAGELPTSEDLFRTISGGLHGTGMPPFADLPELQRWSVVAYLRTLSPKFARPGASAATPIAIPAVPSDLALRVTRGRAIYVRAQCGSCHGDRGAGNGPVAAHLKDAQGVKIKPRNFSAEPLKYGNDPATIYRELVTGLDGTPMASFKSTLSESELWDVVAYVRSLIGDTKAAMISARDVTEVRAFVNGQQKQASHAVVDGCGCQARRRRR